MGRADWQRERDEALRHENWSVRGPNRVVKVVPLAYRAAARLGGFVTVARFINGMTPDEIEAALGLRVGSLKSGAAVYSFSRCPMPSEYEYELTADRPDGLAQTFMSDPEYPPGRPTIHQWRIRTGIEIPVASGAAVRLLPGQRFLG